MAGPSLTGLVNKNVLKWARTTARISVEDAADKAGLSIVRLEAFEAGTITPTLTQVRTLANLYKRGVPVFFLDEIPKATRQPMDFRRFELRTAGTMSPRLAIAIREASAKRESALRLFDELENEPPVFDLHPPKDASAEALGEHVAASLGLPVSARSGWRNHYDALNAWRAAVENAGVIVMHVSGVDLDEMRGCSLAFDPLPVILLNSSDAPLARVFTLLHEVAHLTRKESGLCDLREEDETISADADAIDQVEVFCNRVAGAALIPRASLLGYQSVAAASQRTHWTDAQLNEMRTHYWASREVALRRLLVFGKTSQQHYRDWRKIFRDDYARMRGQKKGDVNIPQSTLVVMRNGKFLTGLALDAYESSAITGSELSRLLGTKLNHLPGITALVRGNAQ